MIRKLTAKVQKIVPNLPSSARGFSNAFVIEPETEELLERKGTVYTVFHINSSEEFDTTLISKIVSDVLHDSYYQSENISPIQSLEKSIVEVRDRVTKLTNESIKLREAQVEFNILTAALWGNVMYLVCYGSTNSYLVRDGNVKPVNSNSEGRFSAASGVVKDEDVLIFTSHIFSQKIPPEVLLNSAVSLEELPAEASALLLKIEMDTEFTENEIVDFGDKGNDGGKSKDKKPLFHFLANIFSSGKLHKEEKISAAVTDLRLKKGWGNKEKVSTIVAVAGVLLVASIIWTLKNNRKNELANTDTDNQSQEVLSSINENSTNVEQAAAADPAVDQQYKIQRITPEVFYDLKLTEPNTSPNKIKLEDSSIVVSDSSLKKVYVSEISVPKFTVSDKEYVDEGISAKYLGNTYTLSADKITKVTAEGEESTWTQNEILTGGRSISVEMSIYVLRDDGMLLKFLRGVREDFALTGLDKPLSGAVQVLTSYDFDNIYVADAGNKRIVVLDKEGVLISQYVHKEAEAWSDIKGLAVSSDEKTIYVLAGSKVYVVGIDQNAPKP